MSELVRYYVQFSRQCHDAYEQLSDHRKPSLTDDEKNAVLCQLERDFLRFYILAPEALREKYMTFFMSLTSGFEPRLDKSGDKITSYQELKIFLDAMHETLFAKIQRF